MCAVCEGTEELWEDENEGETEFLNDQLNVVAPSLPQDESDLSSTNTSTRSVVLWLTGFLLLLQAKHFIPNAAMNALLKFLSVLFRVMGRFSAFVASVVPAIPPSVFMLRKASNNYSDFTKYVVCSRCHRLYRFSDCVTVSDEHQGSKTCAYVRFPNHPQARSRGECGCALLKTVQLASGRRILYPFKVFPYKTLSSSLQELLLRPGFADLCQHWKSRSVPTSFQDVYDGKIWKEFQVIAGEPFLSSTDSLGLGLMINVDWFQPFKHSIYSVGVIYLTVMNLPRSVRFKRQNILLIGILPGPSEPKHDINAYTLNHW